MGSWDLGAFENDDGRDLADEVQGTQDLRAVEAALDVVLASRDDDYLDARDGARVIAAAEIVTLLLGHPSTTRPLDYKITGWALWLKLKIVPPRALLDKAQSAVSRVLTMPSELPELWQDAEHGPGWREGVADLQGRLRLCAGLSDHAEAVACATQCLDAFMAAFNARDLAAWERTFNFPSVRLASNALVVIDKPGWHPPDTFTRGALSDWHHSAWERRAVIHAGAGKVHFDTCFTRYRADGSVIGRFDSIYVVTKEDGHWGVKARSSFAP